MAAGARPLWKGWISFGLARIPVGLHPATRQGGIDFDRLDRRTLDPVGHRRVDTKTGREAAREDIVRGVKSGDGSHVVLDDEEIRAAFPKSTRSIDIETFVRAGDVPSVYLDRPYDLVPDGKGARVCALLREALAKTGRAGLARVVIQTRQHLAALVPAGPALVLDLLRRDADMRDRDRLGLPAEGVKAAGLGARELEMAVRLVDDMAGAWEPAKFRDSFRDDVMALVERKAAAGGKRRLAPRGRPPTGGGGAGVIDLVELLRRSLRGGDRAAAKSKAKAKAGPAPADAAGDDAAAAQKAAPARRGGVAQTATPPAAKKRAATAAAKKATAGEAAPHAAARKRAA